MSFNSHYLRVHTHTVHTPLVRTTTSGGASSRLSTSSAITCDIIVPEVGNSFSSPTDITGTTAERDRHCRQEEIAGKRIAAQRSKIVAELTLGACFIGAQTPPGYHVPRVDAVSCAATATT